MIYFISTVLVILFALAIGKLIKHNSLYPMLPYRYNFGKRRVSFLKVLELLSLFNAKIIIETGTSRHGLDGARSQGASTIVFGIWTKQNNAILHSVDINEESVRIAQLELDAHRLNLHVQLHLSDSLTFLSEFNEQVDFLYLDSYDYSKVDEEVQRLSQQHHLKEFKAIEKQLHKNTIVLIDDCNLPGGGKGKEVIAYMQTKGWQIVMEKYQVLLLHKDSSYFTV